mgnify:CR=1 FL=1|jgi:hypothetical protein
MPFFEIELQDHTMLVVYRILEGMTSTDYDVPDDEYMLEHEETTIVDEDGNEVNELSEALKAEVQKIDLDDKIFRHYQINY